MNSAVAAMGPTRPRAASQVARLGLAGWLVALYLFGRMFMVFGSGRPQPADLGLAVGLLFALRPNDVAAVARAAPAYVAFVGWVGLINGVWGLLRGVSWYAMPFVFQIYNLAIVALVMKARLASPARFDAAIELAVRAAAWAQVGILLSSGQMFRASGTFRQSNQLAYWSVCLLALYLSVQPKRRATRDLVVVAPLAWTALASTSRAGLVAFALLAGSWLFSLLRNSPFRLAYLAGLGLVALLATTLPAFGDYVFELEVADHIENRFTKDSATDEVALRNTDRISAYPSYAVVGAGEGDFARFPHSLPIEIHSTPMTILFSYGILGVLTFGSFLQGLLRRATWIQRMAVASMLLYSVTHNGLRFTFFWATLGAILAQPRVDALQSLSSDRSEPT